MDPEAIPNFSNLGPKGIPLGTSPTRPFTIFAHLLGDRLDTFLIQNLYAAAVARNFEHARLFVFHSGPQSFKRQVTTLNSAITHAWRVDGDTSLPLEFFDASMDAPIKAGHRMWYEQGCAKPNLMLLPSMMDYRHLGAFGRPPRLVLPDDRISDIAVALRDRGLDPNWWFCAMAVPDTATDETASELKVALRQLATLVGEEFGASIVLVGNPSITLDPLPIGVIDGRALPHGVIGQGFAVARSRFLLEMEPSPWLWPAFGFNTPWVRFVASKTVLSLPGRGFVVLAPDSDTRLVRLADAARAMITETEDCSGWRVERRAAHAPAPNRMLLPMPRGPAARELTPAGGLA